MFNFLSQSLCCFRVALYSWSCLHLPDYRHVLPHQTLLDFFPTACTVYSSLTGKPIFVDKATRWSGWLLSTWIHVLKSLLSSEAHLTTSSPMLPWPECTVSILLRSIYITKSPNCTNTFLIFALILFPWHLDILQNKTNVNFIKVIVVFEFCCATCR